MAVRVSVASSVVGFTVADMGDTARRIVNVHVPAPSTERATLAGSTAAPPEEAALAGSTTKCVMPIAMPAIAETKGDDLVHAAGVSREMRGR